MAARAASTGVKRSSTDTSSVPPSRKPTQEPESRSTSAAKSRQRESDCTHRSWKGPGSASTPGERIPPAALEASAPGMLRSSTTTRRAGLGEAQGHAAALEARADEDDVRAHGPHRIAVRGRGQGPMRPARATCASSPCSSTSVTSAFHPSLDGAPFSKKACADSWAAPTRAAKPATRQHRHLRVHPGPQRVAVALAHHLGDPLHRA